jgi:hypothetical protein
MIYPHALVLYPSELATDPDGNPVRRPTATGIVAAGFVQPVDSSEDTTTGQASEIRCTLFLEPTAPRLDAFSQVEWLTTVFETVGSAQWWADPDDTVSYWRVTLRTTGV